MNQKLTCSKRKTGALLASLGCALGAIAAIFAFAPQAEAAHVFIAGGRVVFSARHLPPPPPRPVVVRVAPPQYAVPAPVVVEEEPVVVEEEPVVVEPAPVVVAPAPVVVAPAPVVVSRPVGVEPAPRYYPYYPYPRPAVSVHIGGPPFGPGPGPHGPWGPGPHGPWGPGPRGPYGPHGPHPF